MSNPNFMPTYSTNDIWRDNDSSRCLTDDLDAIDAIHTSLPSTYAAKNHTHTGYATTAELTAVQDALSNKANANHTHTEYALTSHNHDTSYYKKSDVDSKLSSKADSITLTSHTGNADVHVTSTKKTDWDAAYTHSQSVHAPSTAEANQNAFSKVNVGNSTVSADAKTDTLTMIAGNNVTLTPNTDSKSVTIASKDTVYTHPITSGNKHIPSGGTDGQILRWSSDGAAVWGKENGGDKIVTTTGTGEAYVASVDGITSLVAGVSFVMIPNVGSTKVMPTLNVNGLGAKNIRMKISANTTATTPLSSSNMLVANKPVRVMYDGAQWVIDIVRPSVANLYGTVCVSQGGTGATDAATARTNLDVYSKSEVAALIRQIIAES